MKSTFLTIFAAACLLVGCSNNTDNTMTIRKINIDPTDSAALEAALNTVEAQQISNCNWPERAPYRPEASFRAFHTGEFLVIRYDVREESTRAEASEDGGRVWEDSCVEFFISPGSDDVYYNFEANCIGRMHIGHRKAGGSAELADGQTYGSIRRIASMQCGPYSLKEEPADWNLTLIVPASALYADSIRSWDGLKCTMNFYKCGDKCAREHFLSWAPIENEKPNFHLPAFFGKVSFE